MAEKIWEYRSKKLKREDIENISNELGLPRIMTALLLNRSIKKEDISAFLAKSLKSVRNPMLMNDMEKAAQKILDTVKSGAKIVVYGDYDVDGITSAAMLTDFLRSLGADVSYYIPDRADEGYGMNIKAINKFIKQGVKLIITVDCGITALGEVSFAKLMGTEVIVTDHHSCKERLPEDAYAIINPKRPDTTYPFDSLAGAGVAFKLILAMAILLKMNTTQCFYKYIDLAAIGTIADIVSLTDENRVIADKGVAALQNPERPGVKALIKVSGADKRPFTATSVAFSLAPRINAAGRLGNASLAVELLLEKDESKALEAAEHLDAENTKRRETELEIYNEALEMIAADINFSKKKVIVLAKRDWHSGVIGIVAARLCDMYYKPCILISVDECGEGKGSGRSIPSFNLFDALSHCEDLLSDFGGHTAAAGLSINESQREAFELKINKYADGVLSDADMIPKLYIDCPVTERDISLASAKMLENLEPFGAGNERPVFSIDDVVIADIMPVGADGKHLRMRISKNNVYMNCIGFSMGHYAEEFKPNDRISVAFNIDINRFQGRESVQLVIKDIKRRD